jgi:twitching motility protein PilT
MPPLHENMLSLLKMMKEKNASDLHVSAGVPPHLRVHGRILCTALPALSADECEKLLFSFLEEEGKKAYAQSKVLDFSYGNDELGRFRVNLYQQRGSIAAAIRILPMTTLSFDTLGLPADAMRRICNLSHGLVLVCGPVGSGKTTTMASMIEYINKTRNCHIIAIEDPIEYVHRSEKSLIHQREVRRDTPNFIDALKYILREDPDVVIIGEMRDLETITAALTIAETGHLVFATLHTGDTSESIRRIIDSYSSQEQSQVVAQLAYTLMGVINQILIPTVTNDGRAIATEVMLVNPAIQTLIRENKVEQIYSHIQMGAEQGMHTMNQSLCDLVRAKKILPDMALGETKRMKELVKLLESK